MGDAMLLDRIEVFGYRRLLEANAYVGRKTVAFVGPNEAGKSTVLSALRLFNSSDAVPEHEITRSLRGKELDPERAVVRISFVLDATEKAAAAKLPIQHEALRHLVYSKRADGSKTFSFVPAPKLTAELELIAARAWPTLSKALTLALRAQAEEGDLQFDADDVDTIAAYFSTSGSKLPTASLARVVDGIEELLDQHPGLAPKAEALSKFQEWAGSPTRIHTLVRDALGALLPDFLQFTDDLRSIRDEYPLFESSTEADPALANLLRLSGVGLAELRAALIEPDHLRNLEERANKRLESFFESKWRQEQVTVGLKVTEQYLRVDVRDLVDNATGWIRITERSDGLRTFVALAAFLESAEYARPPILLIDEAEQHLHQNAQGDLIRMLQDLSAVNQVLYTTHSPACLPADLGSSVRFIEPQEGGHSVIRHDFWSIDRNSHVGFNPLLIVMGAGAAAFSSLRSAIVAEGVSDMLMLPTFIKLATGNQELPYQVSPGIATASREDLEKLDFVAAKVAYVVDGDAGGAAWRDQVRDAGVPSSRIRALPVGVGLEDLLDRRFYLDTVALVGDLDRDALDAARADIPIKTALSQLRLKGRVPGEVAVAECILGRHESGEAPIKLSTTGLRALQGVHRWAMRVVVP